MNAVLSHLRQRYILRVIAVLVFTFSCQAEKQTTMPTQVVAVMQVAGVPRVGVGGG